MRIHSLLAVLLLSAPPSLSAENWSARADFTYDPAYRHVSNPGRGFVPYPGAYAFPHSMEYRYFGFAELMPAPGQFDFAPIEDFLETAANRGNQGIFRVYFDYPNNDTSVPAFLRDAGVSLTTYTEHGGGESPAYDHPALVQAMTALIAELGSVHDGDPRIAYIQVGLLGHWGEWHTWPNSELFAHRSTQETVLESFSRAFQETPLLVSQDSLSITPTHDYARLRIGLHDDAFANGTLGPDDWMFVPRLRRYGLTDLWQKLPIGGEVLPSLQSIIWDDPSGAPQDFFASVRETHATWLLNHGVFTADWEDEKRARAIEGAKALGYQLFVQSVELAKRGDSLLIRLEIANHGAAPFYHGWPLVLELSGQSHQLGIDLATVVPSAEGAPFVHEQTLSLANPLTTPPTQALLRAQPPDPRLKPFLFANDGAGARGLTINFQQ